MALDRKKCDSQLGRKVHEHLKSLKLETPGVTVAEEDRDTPYFQGLIERIASHHRDIMLELGLDLTDDSLCDTPMRVAKMYVNETMWGLFPENFPKLTVVDNKFNYQELTLWIYRICLLILIYNFVTGAPSNFTGAPSNFYAVALYGVGILIEIGFFIRNKLNS